MTTMNKIVKNQSNMNKLEGKLIDWHKQHFKKSGTFEEHSGFYLENSSQLDIAKTFYDFASSEIKTEVEKEKQALIDAWKQPERVHSSVDDGYIMALNKVLRIIEKTVGSELSEKEV